MVYLRWVYRCLTLENRLCMHPWMEVKLTPSYFANLAWLSSLQIHESRRFFYFLKMFFQLLFDMGSKLLATENNLVFGNIVQKILQNTFVTRPFLWHSKALCISGYLVKLLMVLSGLFEGSLHNYFGQMQTF